MGLLQRSGGGGGETMRDRGGFVLGVLVGAAAGLVAGLLLAPASGEETRRRLGERAAEAGGRARERAAQLVDRVREGAAQVGERATEAAQALGQRVRAQVGSWVGAVQQTAGEALRADTTAPVLAEAAAAVDDRGGGS
jgi:gas vesicle protein